MRKASLFALIGISLFILVGASVWEGAAEMSEDLPKNGRYIATNSLPLNTVVDVTNLENNKSDKFIVISGLNTSGFLALLSKDAADALDIKKGALGRIRLSQDPDPLSLSSFIVDPGIKSEFDDFTLEPVQPRPPEGGGPVLDPSQTVPGYTPPSQGSSEPRLDPLSVIDPVRTVPAAPPVSTFSAPIIGALEKGMYYVQVAAYRNKESVEYEITRRIDKDHPVVIEINPESGDPPIYRVLIGPIKFEQSGEILERYKTTFQDAFVRIGL